MNNLGNVYLIHFDQPYKHARHYLGFCEGEVEKRFEEHLHNRGARLLSVLNAAGIKYSIARVWVKETRDFERKLKNMKNTPRLCPICRQLCGLKKTT